MIDLREYICEKLVINDNVKSEKMEPGDKVMVIEFVSNKTKCLLRVATINSYFRNTIYVDYDEGVNGDRMFELIHNKELYIGESNEGNLLFSKNIALELIDKCGKDKKIYKDCVLIVNDDYLQTYLQERKEELEKDD